MDILNIYTKFTSLYRKKLSDNCQETKPHSQTIVSTSREVNVTIIRNGYGTNFGEILFIKYE